MKNLIRTSVYVLAISVGTIAATPLMASPVAQQDRDHDNGQMNRDHDNGQMNRDRDHDRDNRGDEAYINSKYYKQGWNDGLHHKRKNKKWKNDNDRMAYEAGLAHGERGEQWHKPMRDNDHHDNDHHDNDRH
jgi:hypothetical protein